MKIIDMTEEHEDLYCACLEDWNEDMMNIRHVKQCWLNKMRDRGLHVKLAMDENDKVGGVIQYLPIEESPADGQKAMFVKCIWVHGYKEGRGDFQKKGMGKALLIAAEDESRALGATSMVAWGLSLPVWMRASWYAKQGYVKADKSGTQVLMWKPFEEGATRPAWRKQLKSPKKGDFPGKVAVTAFTEGACPVQNLAADRARKAAEVFGDSVLFREFNTSDRKVYQEWGILDGLYVDGRNVQNGPPVTYDKLLKIIGTKVKHLR